MSSGDLTPNLAAVLDDQRRAAAFTLAAAHRDHDGAADILAATVEAERVTELILELATIAVKLGGAEAESRLRAHLLLLAATEADHGA